MVIVIIALNVKNTRSQLTMSYTLHAFQLRGKAIGLIMEQP